MEKSQLPLLRKKKAFKDSASREKNEKSFHRGTPPEKNSPAAGVKDLRDSPPNNQKALNATPKRDMRSMANTTCLDVDSAPKDGVKKSGTQVNLEWSKYMVKGGSPSGNYQKFSPERSSAGGQIQKCSTGLTSQKTHLPHQASQHCFATKFSSTEEYSPSAIHHDPKTSGSPGPSAVLSVFTFDEKHLYDHDSSPIYHELDPIDGYNPPVNHTYQSITEIREEVERLQANSAGNFSDVHSHSGSAKSPVRSNSGSVLSSIQNSSSSSSKRHLSRTLPSLLTRPLMPRSPTPVSPAQSPTAPPQGSRAQSIFSKLWLQKKTPSKDNSSSAGTPVASSNGATVLKSPTSRNLSLEAICIDVLKVPKAKKTPPTVYAVTSPPPITDPVFANYYQNFDRGQKVDGGRFDYYGLPSERSLRGLCSPSKRSFSESNSYQSSVLKKSQSSMENRLPWRTCRDLSPGRGRAFFDGWDVVRFGEPLDSPGGTVSLETFKGPYSKSSSKQNKSVTSLSSPGHSAGKVRHGNATATSSKKESAAAKMQSVGRTSGRSSKPNEEATDAVRSAQATPKRCLHRTQLSKSQENVLSGFPHDAFCSSRPGSFESLLSEDDVFLPGCGDRLNVLAAPSRTTFSSPSCGIRMAELRAGRRKSDSKSPSPEPPTPTPPPFLPLFQIPAPPCHVEAVVKQDVAVQTSPIMSPARLGGRSPHRCMHTILEEDHSDQGVSADGKATLELNSRELESKNVLPERRRREGRIREAIRSRSDNSLRSATVGEGCQTNPTTDNLLGAIRSAEDDDNSEEEEEEEEERVSGEIRMSCHISRPAETDGFGHTDEPDAVETESVAGIEERRTSPALADCDSSARSFSAGSETGSATASPVSRDDAEATCGISPKWHSKTSRLRAPKPAKFLTTKFGSDSHRDWSMANRCSDDISKPSRYSSLLSRGRVGEIRSLAPPLKQFSDFLPNTTVDTTKHQSSIEAVGPVGTGSHVAAEAGGAEPSIQQPSEVLRPGPQGPVKSGRNGTQHKVPIVQSTKDRKKNSSHLKSPFDPSGSRDRIDPIGGTTSNGTSGRDQRPSTDFNGSYPAGRSTGSSFPSIPLKCESVAATTRHSSLSSSLTSSSGSVQSAAESEPEGTGATRPQRKEPLTCVGRPGGTVRLPDGKGQEKSRLALPKISVIKCKDSTVTKKKSQTHLQLSNDVDDEAKVVSSMEFSSA